nr:hypothetical protein [Tanacetum cinerariifolium]
EAIRSILEVDFMTQESRDIQAAKVFESMGGYAPTVGIIGAVMGLIHVMGNLADPNQLGSGIAVAARKSRALAGVLRRLHHAAVRVFCGHVLHLVAQRRQVQGAVRSAGRRVQRSRAQREANPDRRAETADRSASRSPRSRQRADR